MDCGKKINKSASWAGLPALVRVLRPLAPSVASFTSVANDKGDNEMISGAVHRSPGICFTAGQNRNLNKILNYFVEDAKSVLHAKNVKEFFRVFLPTNITVL